MERIRAALTRVPVAVLTGARQSGKTTLSRQLLTEDSPNLFDLEDPVSLARLEEPRIALDDLGLERVAVVYPGSRRSVMGERVEAVPITLLAKPGRLFAEQSAS